MKRKLARLGWIIPLGALAVLGLTACDIEEVIEGFATARVEASETQTASFTLAVAPTLEIESSNGAVTIRGVEGQADVQVKATLRSRGETLEEAEERLEKVILHMDQDGDRIVLRYVSSEQVDDVAKYSGVSFDVTLPPAADVDVNVETSNGTIDLENIEGLAELDTSNGRIRVTDFAGEVSADTSNGAIDVTRSTGTFRLDTSNGSIDVREFAGAIDAETSNGAIEFAGDLIGPTHHLSTSNGHILVRLDPAASLQIEARTSNASITTTLPLAGDTSGKSWSAQLNPPATDRLNLRTSNGTIRIQSK